MNNDKTKCDNCNEESISDSAQGSGFPDNGIELYPPTLGYYGGFWDNFPLNPEKPAGERVVFCHDCTAKLLRSFPALLKGLDGIADFANKGKKRYGMHPCSDTEPCCEFAWNSTGNGKTIMLVNPETKQWEEVAFSNEV